MSKKVIGIDLGTGNSAVSTIENGKAVIIPNAEGGRTTPSIIALKNGERKVGEAAKRQRVVNPKETISNIKRFMGSDFNKCGDIIKKVTYDVIDKSNKPRVVVEGHEFSPEELSSMILTKMKKTAEDFLGGEVKDAVITCPAWFDNAAREATKLAGEMAGLNVHRIINEPTAAILASNIDTKDGSKIILVADIGQGTTDFSVCEISEGMVEVLASKGDVFLGGSDFDDAVASWIIGSFAEETGVDLSKDSQALQRILEAAEKAKIELSSLSSTEINLPYIGLKDGSPVHLTKTLTRAKMESLTSGLVDRVIACGKEAVEAAKIKNEEISSVLLVGGQSRSSAIQEALSEIFKAPLNKSVNPDEAVSLGAAIQCDIICGGDSSNDMVLLDVTPISMGIETLGGVFTKLIESNTTIPCRKTEVFSTAVDNQSSVDINVLQGERPMAKDNKSVGVFRLDGIMPARRGVPQIEVSFDIDANGILKVTAKDKATNKEQSIQIQSKANLSTEEIERIKKEAAEHAEQDKKEREIADIVNKGDSIIFQNEKLIEEHSDKLSEEDKSELLALVENMKEAVKAKNVESINSIDKAITDKWNVLSSKLYNQTMNTENTSNEEVKSDISSSENANVQDAEFEEVK